MTAQQLKAIFAFEDALKVGDSVNVAVIDRTENKPRLFHGTVKRIHREKFIVTLGTRLHDMTVPRIDDIRHWHDGNRVEPVGGYRS